ncbi:MAG: acetate--CoA ligase family protein [Pirellulaceae bacterium]
MSSKNLDKLFRPRNVAVIGASEKATNIGSAVVKNLLSGGFAGQIFPVNPKYSQVHGLRCYPQIFDATQPIDLAVVCTPAGIVPDIVEQCGAAGIRGLLIITAGFREMGSTGRELEEQVRIAAGKYADLRIIGPNCVGLLSPGWGLNASFAAGNPQAGKIAFLSQSGALCTAVLDWALDENVGFSHFVSVGNMIDVDFGDLLEYFLTDGSTEAVVMYIEAITSAAKFLAAARTFSMSKPIIAYKAGRFAESAAATRSHTGAMAGEDSIYEAAFARTGIVRVNDMEALFDCAELLARRRFPTGPRLGVVSNAGGPGAMATDALLARKGTLAKLQPTSLEQLNAVLPTCWSKQNPVDVLGDAPPTRFVAATDIVLGDPNVDAVLALFAPQAMSEPTETARQLISIVRNHSKPVLAVWMGGRSMKDGIALLNQARIPTYSTPEKAVAAFQHLVTYARYQQELLDESDMTSMPLAQPTAEHQRQAVNRLMAQQKPGLVNEVTAKAILQAYEIPVNETVLALTADEAATKAADIGFPVVLKILSPQVSHKTEVGGVLLNLHDAAAVIAGFDQILTNVKHAQPDAAIDGVSVQKMIRLENGFELIVGAKRDSEFGPVLMVGAGGITAEILQDKAVELAPVDARRALKMLQRLRCWKLLDGFRNRPRANVEQVTQVLQRLSQLMIEHPEIKELDINPLVVSATDVLALDARMVV